MKHLLQWAIFFSKCPASILLVSEGNNNAQEWGAILGTICSLAVTLQFTLHFNIIKIVFGFVQSK